VDFNEVIITVAISVLVYFVIVYWIARSIKDNSIIDIAWGGGQVIIATTLLVVFEDMNIVRALVSLLVIFWGLRLAVHIGLRKVGKPEDWRYAAWRKDWGNTYWWRVILQVYVLQGLLMLIVATPLYIVTHDSNISIDENIWFTTVGASVWWFGFLFESLGDWQLVQFTKGKKNKGKIMQDGFWKYTRHPNYFGEVTQWWGLFIIVIPLNYGLLAIVSPLLITFLILKVPGITRLEDKYKTNKAYQKYKKKTPAFFPLPPRK